MAEITEHAVLAALRSVRDNEGTDIVAHGMIRGLTVKQGHVQFAVEVDAADGARLEPLRLAAERAVAKVPGVLSVTAVLTAERPAAVPHPPATTPKSRKILIPGVRSIVAVASGKGGVGKSTTAVNLACALAQMGLRIGLLDADIYGPSQPRLLGISGKPQSPDGKTWEPMRNHGIACMSIGFLMDQDAPVIWRGPMVMGALQQMLRDVRWGELDMLVVDLPPGTGDAQLTMAQSVAMTGAVIVSTPQDIALLDARKGLNMFRKVDVPVLGIIENMSYFICGHCGERTEIFSHGGAHVEADRLGIPFLGEIPLDLAIRETSDAGTPIVVAQPGSEHARRYHAIAAQMWSAVSGLMTAPQRAAPRIVIE